MTLTPDDLSRLRELLAKATPGPWTHGEYRPDAAPYTAERIVSVSRAIVGDLMTGPNAEAIVALRNNAEALLDAADLLAEMTRDLLHATGWSEHGGCVPTCPGCKREADIDAVLRRLTQ